MPMNDRAAVSRMPVPMPSVAATMIGGIEFGRTWKSRVREGLTPIDLAAVTYSSSLTDSTLERVTRAYTGILTMAMAIGADADEVVLGKFIEGTKNSLFYAENAKQLRDFFKFVTMSVTIRTRSQTPDVLPEASVIDVKPATIEARSEKPKSAAQTLSDETRKNEQPSEEGYW